MSGDVYEVRKVYDNNTYRTIDVLVQVDQADDAPNDEDELGAALDEAEADATDAPDDVPAKPESRTAKAKRKATRKRAARKLATRSSMQDK